MDINPKSVKTEELYGYISMATREWKDGLLSKVMRDLGEIPDEKPKWIILDGDLDANWIEVHYLKSAKLNKFVLSDDGVFLVDEFCDGRQQDAYAGLQRAHSVEAAYALNLRDQRLALCHAGHRQPRRYPIHFDRRWNAVAVIDPELGTPSCP